MENTYWFKQDISEPLFPDLLWSRPENKAHAGKLLVIGGNLHGFVAPAEAFRFAESAGIGTARMVLPNSLKKFVGPVFTAGELAPSTPSGSFSRQALETLLSESEWADGVLIAGDLGRNSETAVVLQNFIQKYSGLLIVTKDAADYFMDDPLPIFNRPNTTLVISLAQLQKMVTKLKFPKAISFGMDLLNLIEILHDLTAKYSINLVVKHLENIIVAVNGSVSSTKLDNDVEVWRVKTGSYCSVWLIQNPDKPFEALTTSLITD